MTDAEVDHLFSLFDLDTAMDSITFNEVFSNLHCRLRPCFFIHTHTAVAPASARHAVRVSAGVCLQPLAKGRCSSAGAHTLIDSLPSITISLQTWFTKQLRGMYLLGQDDDGPTDDIISTRFRFTLTAASDVIIKVTDCTVGDCGCGCVLCYLCLQVDTTLFLLSLKDAADIGQ